MLEKFQNLNISEVIIRALNEMGFEEPTPIQAESIPIAMSGSDMIGQAQTGTVRPQPTASRSWKKS